MRVLLILCLVLLAVAAADAEPHTYTKQELRRFVLDDFCVHDCAGYLRTHSARFRRIYARALDGDARALRKVFRDRDFHSGDNESWEEIPGALLFVVGDQHFAAFLADLPAEERRFVLTYIHNAAHFHDAELAGQQEYFPHRFPLTYRFYRAAFPELAVPQA